MARDKEQRDPPRLSHVRKLADLLPMLAELRESGCDRDVAGNRTLHFDQYVTLVLLYLLNPLIDSLRSLQEASAAETVAERLGIERFSLGSFSESVRVFDAELLKNVIAELAGELRPLENDPRLKQHIAHVLTVADGTVLDAVVKVADAFWLKFKDGSPKHAWKLHVQFDVASFCPLEVELTDARNSGKSDEKFVLRQKLKPAHCYLTDRWFSQFTLFNEINAIGSSYVCRAKENSVFEVQGERLLSTEALEVGIVRDAVVRMGLSSQEKDKPNHPIRLIVIEAEEHEKRGGRKGKTAGPRTRGTIVLASNLLDVPAEIVALAYRHRWTIEVFFRFFKQILGCRHLLSQRTEGVEIQMYCAVIACMLINLWTGKRPGKHTINMLSWYFLGIASLADVERYLNRPDNRGVKLRAKDELWKKLGY